MQKSCCDVCLELAWSHLLPVTVRVWQTGVRVWLSSVRVWQTEIHAWLAVIRVWLAVIRVWFLSGFSKQLTNVRVWLLVVCVCGFWFLCVWLSGVFVCGSSGVLCVLAVGFEGVGCVFEVSTCGSLAFVSQGGCIHVAALPPLPLPFPSSPSPSSPLLFFFFCYLRPDDHAGKLVFCTSFRIFLVWHPKHTIGLE